LLFSLFPLLLTLLFGAAPARAWGPEGHTIVALIALRQLTPETQQRIAALLAGDERPDLAAASTWADEIVKQRPETGPWHFVNIPEAEAGYVPARDCPADACAVAQIARWRAVLAAADAPPARRTEALKFLVSLVADVHQPLHVACRALPPRRRYPAPAVPCGADPHGDWGADELKVRFGDLGVSLHHVWDHEVFYGLSGSLAQIAQTLAAGITPAQRQAWAAGTVEAWTNETHRLAHEMAYGQLPRGKRLVIPLRYEAAARNTVELQMQRAGVRLAAVLTQALGAALGPAPRSAARAETPGAQPPAPQPAILQAPVAPAEHTAAAPPVAPTEHTAAAPPMAPAEPKPPLPAEPPGPAAGGPSAAPSKSPGAARK
jgi:hypothetical protein